MSDRQPFNKPGEYLYIYHGHDNFPHVVREPSEFFKKRSHGVTIVKVEASEIFKVVHKRTQLRVVK